MKIFKILKINPKTISIIFLVLKIGIISSSLGVLLAFILMKLNIYNSLEFFLNLPQIIQILSCVFYVVLWIVLFYVLYKELS